MNVTVDREQCIACSLCWTDCPEVFAEDPADGKCSIVEGLRVGGDRAKGEAQEGLRGASEGAAANCPVSIIHVA
jgi:ferredoxin